MTALRSGDAVRRSSRPHGGPTRLLLPLLAVLAVFGGCGPQLDGRTVEWSRPDGVTLHGTLVVPEGPGPHPLAVFVPGSGCMPRTHRVHREHATQLRDRGVAVFVYDKRGCGESTGDWRDVGFEPLAEDVGGALDALAGLPEIDRDRIGLIGLSQGGWIALMTAERDPRVRWVIMLSTPPTTPAEQGHAVVELALRHAGHSEDEMTEAVALDRLVTDTYRHDAEWESARLAVAEAADEPWMDVVRIGVQPHDGWNWRWYRSIMDYDPVPALRALPLPILAVYGARDRLVPAARSAEQMMSLAPDAAGPREAHVLDQVGHQLRAGKGADWPESYWDLLERWMTEHEVLPGESR